MHGEYIQVYENIHYVQDSSAVSSIGLAILFDDSAHARCYEETVGE
jgi:hypothetical protein